MSTESNRPSEPETCLEDLEEWDLAVWIVTGVLPRLMLVGIVGVVIFVAYDLIAAPLFPNCNGDVLFGGTYRGGAASSVKAAAVLGGALWLAAGLAACWLRSRRTFLLVGFVVLYALGLIVLGAVVSPLIWGPRVCA